MEQITLNEMIRDNKIEELEEEVKRLKEIIKWQSFTMANFKPKKLKLKKEVENGKRF